MDLKVRKCNMIPITMQLDETDIYELKKFIVNQKIEQEIEEEYLILYNFAMDCIYSECIQPELIKYLLPFYLKAMEWAVLYNNKIATDIYYEFNLAMFFNQKNFRYAVGERNYQAIMKYYIHHTIKKMERQNVCILEWISLFNTTTALYHNNIKQLFRKIFEGSLEIKYSFFQYLSILLFKENDNLLAINETQEFWTSHIWDFDDGYFSKKFFWNDAIIKFFDREINRKRIETLFGEIKPFIYHILEPKLVELFYEEMNESLDSGIFYNRKTEYLKKINDTSREYIYWDTTF